MPSASDTRQPSVSRELILAGSWLTCAIAVALPGTLWWGSRFAGESGVAASATAAALCWVAGFVALVVRTRFPKPQDVVAGTLGAMLVRMVLVFGGGLLVASLSPEFVKAAFWGQLVIYFTLTLAVESWLAVRWVKSLEATQEDELSEQSTLSESGAKAI